ncbi:hypothetical protein ACHHYP_07233 [Achlya hypogyna]|uniref:Zinc finger PHD-type domain-containing protein n=1 Tax=Achlya hypogyna TaxID=1202772 RepID=A0A1V9ZMD7_ACHHY|nr:hypothetical protein ACHHYP_07233 [Achlya hypogyna]
MTEEAAVLGELHKQHARVRDVLDDICDRLADKEAALAVAESEMEATRGDMSKRTSEWAKEKKTMLTDADAMKEMIKDMEMRIDVLLRQRDVAREEAHQLKETLKEREELVTKVLSEKDLAMQEAAQIVKEQNLEASDFLREEKSALALLEQVHQTATSLEVYTADLTKTVNQLTKEVQSIEESQGTCEAMLLAHKDKPIVDAASSRAHQAMLDALCEQVGLLQSQNMAYEGTTSRLEEAVTKAAKEAEMTATQIRELQLQLDVQGQLVAKYQASSLCGTQAIDTLQGSIALICTQYDSERETLLKQVEELSAASIACEHKKLLEVQELQAKIALSEATVQEKSVIIEQLEATLLAKTQGKTSDEHISSTQQTQAPSRPVPCVSAPLASSQALSPALTATESVATCETSLVCTTSPKATRVPDMCPTCQEEPFGFMVRCQQCKQQFHAGCVRSKRQKTSRAGVYVFVCDQCSPAPTTTTPA